MSVEFMICEPAKWRVNRNWLDTRSNVCAFDIKCLGRMYVIDQRNRSTLHARKLNVFQMKKSGKIIVYGNDIE